ncbi:MAG: CbbX protein, partial [Dongiaceae bacterium]
RSRIAHHIDFPDYDDGELLQIAELMLAKSHYVLSEASRAVLATYIVQRRRQPHFANARSIRNALDRAKLRQANRLFENSNGPIDAAGLSTIEAADILASRVFAIADQDRKVAQ